MRYLVGFVFVLALSLMGCTETGGETCGQDAFDCPCQRPLDEYCQGSDCPSWEQAIAAAEKSAVRSGCDCGLWPAAFGAGRCGDLRYVREDCGDEFIEFFDASGTLVAAYWWTDGCGSVCRGSCSVDYGFRPECEMEQERDFCDQLPDLTCRDWCANEPQGSSCHQGPPESLQECHEDCLQDYGTEEEQSGCGYFWIRIKGCQINFECEDSASKCDWYEDQLVRCQANSYCEANSPAQDRQDCIEQYLRCDGLDVYDCIDEPSCTPVIRANWCSALTEEQCAELAGQPAPEEGEGFCAEWLRGDLPSSFGVEHLRFCAQDSDCPAGDECIVGFEVAPRGECHEACVDECREDADCPEGYSCGGDLCGACSVITGWCWDEFVRYCYPLQNNGNVIAPRPSVSTTQALTTSGDGPWLPLGALE